MRNGIWVAWVAAAWLFFPGPADEAKAGPIEQGGAPVLQEILTAREEPGRDPTWEDLLGDFVKGLEELQRQFDDAAEDLRNLPKSDEFRKLKEEYGRLAEELRRLQKEAGRKLEEEILPRVQQELEKLKERLRELRDKEPKTVPI